MRLPALALLLAACIACAAPLASAQGASDRPVRLVTGFPPGGPTDLLARVLGEKLQAAWKQPVIVEARPGASGILAMQQLKAAPPDGTMLVVAPTNTLGVNQHLFPKMGYDPQTDFTLVSHIANIDNVLLVHPSLAANNLNELAAQARRTSVNFGSPANGSQAHLSGEFLNGHFGVKMLHVPYKGLGPALNDLLGGQINMLFTPVAQAVQHVRAGKLRAIALPARERNAALPDVATFAEQGIRNFEAPTWFMLIAPAGMPAELTERVRGATAAALREADVRERLRAFGAEPSNLPAAELPAFLRTEVARWGQIVQAAGIKAD